MSSVDIFNFGEKINEFINDSNKEKLNSIIERFKQNNFEDVLLKTKLFQENHDTDIKLSRLLLLIDATCHAQINEEEKAAKMIRDMYEDSAAKSIDDLILYGNLAFMCDYRLARTIMNDVVKQIEIEDDFDKEKAAQAYLVLGEAEENLQKFIRAARYYKRALNYIKAEKAEDKYVIAFLYFKLGALHAAINETDEAIDYLHKTIDFADDDEHIEIKINSLVSIAKIYGRKKQYEEAIPYLKEVIPMFEGSNLAHKLVHAEALTDMAYNCFARSDYDEAVTYYEQAIPIHLQLTNYSVRELGMIYMQFAYCLEHKKPANTSLAGKNYENAFDHLKQTNDPELLESALADIIRFFEDTNNNNKKRFYENELVKLINEKNQAH